jgi:hypothetical protein
MVTWPCHLGTTARHNIIVMGSKKQNKAAHLLGMRREGERGREREHHQWINPFMRSEPS